MTMRLESSFDGGTQGQLRTTPTGWEAPWPALSPTMIISMPWKVNKAEDHKHFQHQDLKVENELYLWGNVETVFIAEDMLYVGTSNGMHILSLANPSSPNFLSTYQHITACDPVVVEGDWAYVTLRAGNICGGTQNLLEVIDIAISLIP